MRSSIGAGYDVPSSVVVQADGKIVVGGRSHNGSNNDMALVRYKADGIFDSSFDGDKKLFLDFGGNDYLNDVVIQSDGAFVVTGSIGGHLAVGRIQPDGTPDSGFGTAGFVTTVIQANSGGNGVVLQSDGNIVVAGTVNNGNGNEFTNRDFLIARYGGANPITNVAPSGLVLNSVIGRFKTSHSWALQNQQRCECSVSGLKLVFRTRGIAASLCFSGSCVLSEFIIGIRTRWALVAGFEIVLDSLKIMCSHHPAHRKQGRPGWPALLQ